MSFDLETLYSLLPAIYRIRDLEQLENNNSAAVLPQSTDNQSSALPLKALLKVIAEQVGILEENLAQLYDDQFIETCAEWVIPYIGDLVSYHTPHNTSSQSLRSEVAHTISYRKRKGTATLLEQLARDVTGWDVHVVEMFQRMAATQHMQRPRTENTLVDLRRGEPLARLNTPFDSLMHTGDVRDLSPLHGGYTIPTIGIFVWRLNDYSLTNVPAVRAAHGDGHRYFFSPLGNNLPLLTHPASVPDVAQLAGPPSVATPITSSRLAYALSDYYGRNKSILLTVSIEGQDRDILPDPQQPSDRLRKLMDQGNALTDGLNELYKDLLAGQKLDTTQLLLTCEHLHGDLDALYRAMLSAGQRDLTQLPTLITSVNDLQRGLKALPSSDAASQKSQLEALINLATALYESLQPHLDPQSPDDLFTVADLRDHMLIKKDENGKELPGEGTLTWANLPEDKIAIDPVLGRFALPEHRARLLERMGLPAHEKAFEHVSSTFHYGFSADMGGGEYHRAASFSSDISDIQYVPAQRARIQEALDVLHGRLNPDGTPQDGVIEIRDQITRSGRIEGSLSIQAAVNQRIELRAADFTRPLLVLEGETHPPELRIEGERGSQVTLNGLVISHGIVHVSGKLERLTLRHCTLVPGLALSADGKPQHPSQASLMVVAPYTRVELDHCIIGALRVIENAQVSIGNSIIDATSEDAVAYADPTHDHAGAVLSIENSTIIGRVHALALELASNTIFLAGGKLPVNITRRREGCIRFSYVPPGSRTPRRYQCQPPEEVMHEPQQTSESPTEESQQATEPPASPSKKAMREPLKPQFVSLRYGHPHYCQLLQQGPGKLILSAETQGQVGATEPATDQASIRQGADDEAEMGVFHDLFQPQRETNLRVRLTEYLSFTMEPNIMYMT